MSTYPPTMCGLATFTASLRAAIAALRGSDAGLDVVELVDGLDRRPDRPEVIATMDPADSMSMRRAADLASGRDVVLLQHEYGIWGPHMGSPVLDFVERIGNELVVTLHTLLPDPTPVQRRIIEGLAERAAHIVVPTQSARELLIGRYRTRPSSVAVVPHGTDRPRAPETRWREGHLEPSDEVELVSWGLIGPGKGLEWAIEAVARLVSRFPRLRYTIAGRTHPKVQASQGEAYRQGLLARVADLGLEDNVRFIDEYLTEERLRELMGSAMIAVLPYESTEQMVSGVLVEAVSSHIPVVATAFPHAMELDVEGAVAVVPHRDPDAMAAAMTDLLSSPERRRHMVEAQRRLSDELDWASVADRYEALIRNAVSGSSGRLDHVPTAS